MINLSPDLQKEIILRLPTKSIVKFKTVSKQWRSILESKGFAERRMSLQKSHRKILAAGVDRSKSRFEGDEEVDVVYLNCKDITRPSLTCDGLVCVPVPGWVNVLNPSTGEFLRFPSSPDPVTHGYQDRIYSILDSYGKILPEFWAMGFGKDKVNGSFKVVRMFFDTNHYCEILDVNIGEWRKSTPPPYLVDATRKSACVNGSIYWLSVIPWKLLALDLHTQEFRDVPTKPLSLTFADQLVNLDDRLAISTTYGPPWRLEIWTMDAQIEDGWTMTYYIPLYFCRDLSPQLWDVYFRPVAVSKQGNIFFHDNEKRLFKYYPKTNLLRCISKDTCVISPFVENLLPLRLPGSVPKTFGYQSRYQDPGLAHLLASQLSKFLRRIELPTKTILLTASVVSLVAFRYYFVSSRS